MFSAKCLVKSKKCIIFAPDMKNYLLTALFLLTTCLAGAASSEQEQWLNELNHYIALKPDYDAEREARIDSLRRAISYAHDRYVVYSELFEEYKSYDFDQAIFYVDKLTDEAIASGNRDRIAYAQVERGFALLSAGLFKECCDLMEQMDTTACSDATKYLYYFTYARTLLDMASYNHAGQSSDYTNQSKLLWQQAAQYLAPTDTAHYWYCQATINAIEDKPRLAIERMNLALEDTRIDEHQKAIIYSTMAYLYLKLGDSDQQLYYNIQAAIFDIRSSTKETVALRNVAEWLYQHNQINLAGDYIREALNDANFYNARHRQLEISQILPIIEQENIEQERKLNRKLTIMEILALVLLAGLLVSITFLVGRVRALRHARQTIEHINEELQKSNKIRTEYIGSLLQQQTELIDEMEKYQQWVKKNTKEKRYDELMSVPRQYNAHKKREEFYQRFDEMFIHIFPHFVEDVNALLKPEEHITLKEGELLNAELRIAALLRLGIHHNEVISEVLDYSVNTIYTYKTRLRNRSIYSLQELQEKLGEI